MRGLTAMFSTLNKSAKSEQHTEKKTTTKGEESSNNSSSSSSRGKKKEEKKKKRRRMRSAKGHEREGDEEDGGEKYVHCAVLGDGMVGKTCLTLSYTQRLFTDRYTATVFDNYPVPVSVGEEDFTISVFDTAGQKDYESLRAYTYQCSEVLVLCFSLVDRESFYNVLNCWLPEVQRHTKGKTPLLLVGTQIDLRRNGASTIPSSSFCGDMGTLCGDMGTLCGDMGTLCGDMGTLCGDLATPSSSSWDLRTLSSPPGSSSLGQRACSRDLHTPLSSSCWDMGSVSPSSRLSPCSSDHEIIPPTPSTLRTTASSSSSSSSSVSASRVGESSRFPSSNTSSSSSPRGAFAFPSKHARNSISTVSSSSFSSPSSSFSSADVAVRPFSTYSSCSTSSTASSACDVPPQEQEAEEEVSWEEGSQLARMIGADCYIECSARSQEGVEQVFQHVVFSALKYRKRRGSFLGRLLSKEGRRVKPLALSDKALRRAASTLNIPMVV